MKKARFRIRWITEQMIIGPDVIVGKWCEPLNIEAIRMKAFHEVFFE